LERPRTIANLWRDAVAAGHQDPAYLQLRDDEWHEQEESHLKCLFQLAGNESGYKDLKILLVRPVLFFQRR